MLSLRPEVRSPHVDLDRRRVLSGCSGTLSACDRTESDLPQEHPTDSEVDSGGVFKHVYTCYAWYHTGSQKKAPKFQGRLKCSTFNTDDATQHRAPMLSAGIQVCARQCRRVLNLQAAPHTKQDTPPCNRPICLRARRSQPTVDVVGWHSRPPVSIAHASPDLRSDLICCDCELGPYLARPVAGPVSR